MIASSSTVLANLAYLIGAVVVAVIAGLIVWLRHRQPRSVDANMASFRRGLSALAPDPRAVGPTIHRSDSASRPQAASLTHVRLESPAGAGIEQAAPVGAPAEQTAAEGVGEHAG